MFSISQLRPPSIDLTTELTDVLAATGAAFKRRAELQGAQVDDVHAMLEAVRQYDEQLYFQLDAAIVGERRWAEDAGFAVGYHTAKDPSWLIFQHGE